MGDASSLDGHHPTLWLLVSGVVAVHIGAFLYWCYAVAKGEEREKKEK